MYAWRLNSLHVRGVEKCGFVNWGINAVSSCIIIIILRLNFLHVKVRSHWGTATGKFAATEWVQNPPN